MHWKLKYCIGLIIQTLLLKNIWQQLEPSVFLFMTPQALHTYVGIFCRFSLQMMYLLDIGIFGNILPFSSADDVFITYYDPHFQKFYRNDPNSQRNQTTSGCFQGNFLLVHVGTYRNYSSCLVEASVKKT